MTAVPPPDFHTAAVGAGPANLSLAALMQAHTDETIALFDGRPGPSWHPALMQDGVRMQTSWLKDLVSMVDPTHHLSFMNYLITEGRLFALMNAQFDFIPRAEYERYLTWAAAGSRTSTTASTSSASRSTASTASRCTPRTAPPPPAGTS